MTGAASEVTTLRRNRNVDIIIISSSSIISINKHTFFSASKASLVLLSSSVREFTCELRSSRRLSSNFCFYYTKHSNNHKLSFCLQQCKNYRVGQKNPSPYIVLFVLLQHLFRCTNNLPCELKFCCAHTEARTKFVCQKFV